MRKKEWVAYNYCIAFLDLLGQREEYKNEGLIPFFTSEKEMEAFNRKIKNTIGPIFSLQRDAETMMKGALTPSPGHKKAIPIEHHEIYEKMLQTKIKHQRWSDGLVFFASLGDQNIKCPVVALFDLLGLAGTMCFLGLSKKQPIRGAIDIAWGLELRDGELYGAVVAKAYEIESYVAKYPRIIVSQRTIGFLEAHRQNINNDIYSQCNRQFTEMCLNMIVEDSDGYFIVHYLGDSFREYISKILHNDIYNEAINFVQGEHEKFRRMKNTKLAFRYSYLLSYFLSHPTSASFKGLGEGA
jgi:hypothetical protein